MYRDSESSLLWTACVGTVWLGAGTGVLVVLCIAIIVTGMMGCSPTLLVPLAILAAFLWIRIRSYYLVALEIDFGGAPASVDLHEDCWIAR